MDQDVVAELNALNKQIIKLNEKVLDLEYLLTKQSKQNDFWLQIAQNDLLNKLLLAESRGIK